MPTIAQAQSSFISSGGIDGSSSYTVNVKGEGKKVEFPDGFKELGIMEAMLAEYIGEFLTTAVNNLNATNSISSGDLEESLTFKIQPSGGGYIVNFLANDYYQFVDQGVKGVKNSKNTTSPYSFKHINPSRSHVQAVKKWIQDNRLTALVTDINRYGGTRRERKGLSKPEERAAYVVARSIKKKGIAATNFWTKAFDETFRDFGQKMSEALGRSISVNLEQMATELKTKGTKIPTR